MRRLAVFLLALSMLFVLCACGAESEKTQDEPLTEQKTEPLRIAALKGPTAMGLVKMMQDSTTCDFMLAGSADEITPLLLKGELDAACIPANLAAVLYQKTEGEIVTLAINTLGVLYIVSTDSTVKTPADLRGRTIVGAGKGSTPEYVLRYLLQANGLDPDTDVTLAWKSEHSECVAALASGAAELALLPQPFVTVAQEKVDDLTIALNLNAEWEKLDNGSALITGVVAARRSAVEERGEAFAAFLQDYAASVEWVNANTQAAAALIGEAGIVYGSAAEKALPYCNIVCITGQEMEQKLSGYLKVLFEKAPESVGGVLPAADFYGKLNG